MTRIGENGGGRARRRRFAVAFPRAAALVAAACAVIPAFVRADAIPVFDLRLGIHADHTRIVVELAETVVYGVFALEAPERLVIDFPELDFAAASQTGGAVGLVTGIRHGRFRPDTTRMVVDLAAPACVKRSFLIPPGGGRATRFVLDIEGCDAETFSEWARASQREVAAAAPLRPAAPAPSPPRDERKTVVVDAGHGGIDPGAIGVVGTLEKDLALDAARQLAERLEETGRYRVVMTRDSDIFVGLRDRLAIARTAEADLLLSIHADSIDDSRLRGSHVYRLSEEASDDEAVALAAKENRSDVIGGVDMAEVDDVTTQILIDWSQRQTNEDSIRLADLVVEAFARRRVRTINRPHRWAGFAVLKAPDVPSLLIELGFLSNREDERLLGTREGREPALRAIVDAVDRYFAALAD